MFIFIPIIIAVFAAAAIQSRIFDKNAPKQLTYRAFFSSGEVFEGESIFLYEELTNGKSLPVPNAKIYTELPDGLKLHLVGNGKKEDSYEDSIQSIFVMRGHERIRRRWRVSCEKRGIYRAGNANIVTGDILGLSSSSFPAKYEKTDGKPEAITVLPRAVDLDAYFTSSQLPDGSYAVLRSIITDPLMMCGARPYTELDPMSKINWKLSAKAGELTVNTEEPVRKHSFNIIMNMQSRTIEHIAHVAGNPASVELCITVCASILDSIAAENIPVKIYMNSPPEMLESFGAYALSEEKTDDQITATQTYCGRSDTLSALRLLAALPAEYSCGFEALLDSASSDPSLYAGHSNIIVISSYICERMIIFYENMRAQGINVIFYITTVNQNAQAIPEHIPVFYRSYK